MLQFDPALVKFEIVQLKSVTTAVGGSISVLNPKESTDRKEVLMRMEVPLSVVRAFIMANKKTTKYLKPVYTAVVTYNGHVVSLERHPLGSMGALEEDMGGGRMRRWTPMCELNYRMIVETAIARSDKQWFFDGRFIFHFNSGDKADAVARVGTFLTRDGKFRKCIAQTFDLQSLPFKEELKIAERSCLAFVSSRGAAVSPPIWKDLQDVGMTQLNRAKLATDEADDAQKQAYNFDGIDETLAVNLNFTLKAGVEIGKVFGYEYIEPLQLPRLMIELHTVNLPNVAFQIKATYDTHMRFTHALAWLLGLSRKANTLETYVMMRALMKYLTKKGIFRSSVFDAAHVFKDNKTVSDVKMIPLDTLLKDESFTKDALGSIMDQMRNLKRKRKNDGHYSVGGLLNEE